MLLVAADLMSASLRAARRTLPTQPTPCTEWQLGQLVGHVADSTATLTGVITGAARIPTGDTACARAEAALADLRQAVSGEPDSSVSTELVLITGAFELTLHVWDINTAAGARSRLPTGHVHTLLYLAPIVLDEIVRDGLFGPPLPPSRSGAKDAQNLLALFGRRA